MTPEPARICLGCWENLKLPIPLRGPLSGPFRLFGVRPSPMNPNTCTICEMAFSKIMKARSIVTDATVMFADLRGYTALSQRLPVERLTALLDLFYDSCAKAIWKYDGLLNKTLGDGVLAIFNFPLHRGNHAAQALLAAREIQQSFVARRGAVAAEAGVDSNELGVGVGIDSGDTNFGEFGHTHRDLTVIGTVVNRAARAQGVAEPGEILVTESVRARASGLIGAAGKAYSLKGFDEPVMLFAGNA